MKRILLALGAAATAFLIGCGGGGGSSTPSAPSNPGNPGATATPGGGSTPGPTPTPSQSQNPTTTVVTIGAPGAVAKTAINTLGSGSTQILGTVGRISATQNGSAMSNGAAINVTITSTDKSGSTCLVYVANGASTGTACTYPAVGSTPAPVTIAHVNDGVAIQYNDGPSAPGGTFNVAGNVPGAGAQPTAVVMNNPAVGIGHTTTGSVSPWGGGIAYTSSALYITQNSATAPLGYTTYSNGAAGSSVSNVTLAGALTSAPAGGLITGPDGRLWGTEQNNSTVFAIAATGGAGVATEYGISCASGTSAGSSGNGTLFGPQTGIATDGTSIYVLCANVAAHTSANNVVTEINPTTGATTATCTTGHEGSFSNGAIYANGNIYTEEQSGGGSNLGGGGGGYWLSIPVGSNLATCASGFSETAIIGTGDGNVVLLSDGNLYSETDQTRFSASLTGGTTANPLFDGITDVSPNGGGGLVQDTVLGSKWLFGTASGHDLDMHTAWTGGTNVTPTYLALNAGSAAASAGDCEVALNTGGGFGIIQLPDGKLAWSHATAGLDPASHSWICFANL